MTLRQDVTSASGPGKTGTHPERHDNMRGMTRGSPKPVPGVRRAACVPRQIATIQREYASQPWQGGNSQLLTKKLRLADKYTGGQGLRPLTTEKEDGKGSEFASNHKQGVHTASENKTVA